MTATEQELPLFRSAPSDPRVQALEALLLRLPGWHSAAEILAALDLDPTEGNKRHVRSWAAASDEVISGQLGYQHLSHAPQADVDHFCAAMRSQVEQMSRRVERVCQRRNQI